MSIKNNIIFHILKSDDTEIIKVISEWYLQEWKIPVDKTLQRLHAIAKDTNQFQVLMTVNGVPVATGGLYNHVGLLDHVPRFTIYKKWLALVYTVPEQRHNGYGSKLCIYIQEHAKSLGIDKMFLFTDTAERLYKRLGWTEVDRTNLGMRNVVIMRKDVF